MQSLPRYTGGRIPSWDFTDVLGPPPSKGYNVGVETLSKSERHLRSPRQPTKHRGRSGLFLVALIALLAFPPRAGARRITVAKQARLILAQMKHRGEAKGEIHLALAAMYGRYGRQAEVYSHVRAARRLGIAPSRTNLILGDLYRRLGRFDAAFATFLRVLVLNPGQPYALIQLWKTLYEAQLQGAEVKVDMGNIRDRLVGFGLYFPKALQVEKDGATRSKKLTVLGYNALLADRNRYAAGLFKAAIDALPSNPRAHRGLGIARARRQDFMRAAGAYLLYLELHPNAPDADEIDRILMRYWRSRAKR